MTSAPSYSSSTPRFVAAIDGTRVLGASYEIAFNAHGSTDHATVTLPISSTPDWTTALFRDPAAATNKPVYISIYAGFPSSVSAPANPNDLSQLGQRFYGIVDQYSGTFEDDTVTFTARSLAGVLVDTDITTQGMKNVTTVQFITEQAERFGLKVDIDPKIAPATMMQVLSMATIAGVRKISIWQLLLLCAQRDDADIWVSLDTLHYYAPYNIVRNKVTRAWGKDCSGLSATHSPQFSKNIRVEVRSYSKKTKTSTAARATSNPNGGISTQVATRTVTSSPVFGTTEAITQATSSTGVVTTTVSNTTGGAFNGTAQTGAAESGKEIYVYYVRNLKPQEALDMAQKIWRQISMHEYAIALKFPMTPDILKAFAITSLIVLSGAPWVLVNDQYWPRTITENFEPSGDGWHLTVDAVNHTLPMGAV
jgi:hypothetical protein